MTPPLAPNGGDETKRFVSGKPMDPELVRLLELVKTLPPMTPMEHAIQRRSWVRGEMGMMDPQRSPEEIDALLAQIPEFALLDRIEALEAQLAQVEAVNLDMTARMDRISTGALYADLAARATSAELTVTALQSRLADATEYSEGVDAQLSAANAAVTALRERLEGMKITELEISVLHNIARNLDFEGYEISAKELRAIIDRLAGSVANGLAQ